MPELNTYARLYFPSSQEKEGQVGSSVRKNGDTCKETSNPAIRYLTTKNQIKIAPGAIDIKPSTDLSLNIRLGDKKGVEIKSHKDIIFNALEEITFKTPGKIQLTAVDQIVLLSKNPHQSPFIENEFHT